MTADTQHDDHIWFTFVGQAWAVWKIEGETFYLWRGSNADVPSTLEFTIVHFPKFHWKMYADNAADYIKAALLADDMLNNILVKHEEGRQK